MSSFTKRVKGPESISVLEARWEARGNYGVRQLFELISAVTTNNPDAYRYDMFSDNVSFEAVLRQIGKSKRFQAVYVGSHGDKTGLGPVGNGRRRRKPIVSVRDVVETMGRINRSGNIHGAYFSVCSFGQIENLSHLLRPENRTNLKWVAGYSKDVEWLESAAADMLFWSGYLDSNATDPLARAIQGARNLLNLMPDVGNATKHGLGFGVFKWSRTRDRLVFLLDTS